MHYILNIFYEMLVASFFLLYDILVGVPRAPCSVIPVVKCSTLQFLLSWVMDIFVIFIRRCLAFLSNSNTFGFLWSVIWHSAAVLSALHISFSGSLLSFCHFSSSSFSFAVLCFHAPPSLLPFFSFLTPSLSHF